MNIKNIIFDLGGVIIDLDKSRAIKALEKIGVNDAGELLGEYSQKGPFLMLENGDITASEFFDMVLPKCTAGTTCTDIQNAFEEFLVDIPVERLHMLDRLREKGYKIFVLSNTNPVMFNHWIANEFKKDGKSINDYFDGVVTSFEERMCKPDPGLFQRVLDRFSLVPQETIMLDDSAANVASAKTVLMNAQQVLPDGENSFDSICQKLMDASL